LREPNWRERALLVAVYGRRRVGKTALVEHAYDRDLLWKFEGIEAGNTRTQIQLFLKQLSRCVPGADLPQAGDWDEALTLLNKAIAEHGRSPSGRTVVFLDEFQWMCEMKTDLVSLFKYHWDNFLSRHSHCVFVLCGSISSFIVKKVIRSKALYGRTDTELHLQPLPFEQCKPLFEGTRLADEALDTYLTVGGIPHYLIEMNPRMSLTQNLSEYAFQPSGFLFREFERLFVSHFAGHPAYEIILRALSSGACTPQALAKKCSMESGGTFSSRLRELELAGFVRRLTPLDKSDRSRIVRYRIDDEYLHFYFRFIQPHSAEVLSGAVRPVQILHERAFRQWQGYAFERFCTAHARYIADYLRFSGITYRAGSWFRRPETGQDGAQFDLVFLRNDKVITACELKYGTRLNPRKIVNDFKARLEPLRSAFPHHAIETALFLARSSKAADRLRSHFDHVAAVEDVFG